MKRFPMSFGEETDELDLDMAVTRDRFWGVVFVERFPIKRRKRVRYAITRLGMILRVLICE